MKYRFEKFSKNNVLLSILMVILGLLLIIWPGKTLEWAAKILGIALLLGAVITCFSWYRDRNIHGGDYTLLAIGILCLAAGLVVLIAPHGVITLLPKLIGVAIAVNGVLNLAQSLELRKQGGSWLGPVIMAVLTVVAGLFLVFFSFGAMKAAVMVIGGVIVYNGVSNLLIESKFRKSGKY
jgi:uncharacterized membrane protein HdeD (DUF308 family)